MNRYVITLAISAIPIVGLASFASESTLLAPGEYEVSMRLELPHLEDMGVSKTTKVCVTTGDTGSHGLVVLSDKNPLGKCPVNNVREDGDTLQFDIVCPRGNAAIGWAKYALWADRFDGTIAMKMGGKNMTMTVRQVGHRIGDCKGADQPRS